MRREMADEILIHLTNRRKNDYDIRSEAHGRHSDNSEQV